MLGTDDSIAFSLPICSVNEPASDTIPFDLNTEYKSPVYEDDDKFNVLLSFRKGSERISVIAPIPISGMKEKPSLLLHIAISNGDIKMAKYFLEKGADVSKSCNINNYNSFIRYYLHCKVL